MRLLQRRQDGGYELTSVDGDHPPPYAILSHTWTDGQEITYQELISGTGKDKTGYNKIHFCAEQAATDGVQYFWVDTCCIDKSNQIELSTAINSMFKWYQGAVKCYVYLPDVSVPDEVPDAQSFRITWLEAFRRSRWFTRGWTLQELVAPARVEFFSKERRLLGTRISLEQEVHQITQIPVGVLRGESLANFSVENRMSWASTRTTTMKEDKAYCLLGIFGVFLSLIYGEGEAHAYLRLQEEIQRRYPELELGRKSNDIDTITEGFVRLLPPSCVVPFRRDPDFIDRGTLLDEIREKCSVAASCIALVGLGGVGKSQLAIEYCYQTAEQSPDTWVFWVHASSAARITQGYQAIADQVKLDGRSDPQADVFQLVHNWLRDVKNGRWLLVLDNLDDADALSLQTNDSDGLHSSPRYLTSYLPQCKHSALLITSRTRNAALQLVEEDDIIDIEPMGKDAAQNLLQKKLGKEGDEIPIAELAKALEYMPLALVQAAAFIRQRAPRCSVQRYLADFQKNDQKKESLLDYDGGRLRRDVEAKNAILLTWQITFDHIRHARRSAADLLSLMSFFDRQGIPEQLLRKREWTNDTDEATNAYVENGENDDSNSDSDCGESGASTDDDFEEDIVMLRNYSMIALTTDGTAFDMHRLVQLATRRWLKEQNELEKWKERYVDSLSVAFPRGDFDNWARCQVLYPHAKAALSQEPKSEKSLDKWATLLYNAAWYATDRGYLRDAERFSVQSMEVWQKLFGTDHLNTMNASSLVATVKNKKGSWKEAKELELRVLETSKRVLGEEHLHTLTRMANLALTYSKQGKYQEAEELELRVLETSKRVLGNEHPDTLTSMGNLAITYSEQSNYQEAEELELQVLETRKRVLGNEHPDTLTSMNNLSISLKNQGRTAEAISLLDACVDGRTRVLGPQHPYTLECSLGLERWRREGF